MRLTMDGARENPGTPSTTALTALELDWVPTHPSGIDGTGLGT